MVAAALLLFVTDIIPLCALQWGGIIVLPVLQLVSHASQRLPDLFIAVRGNSMEIISKVRKILSRVCYLCISSSWMRLSRTLRARLPSAVPNSWLFCDVHL